jgi:hypothetical protein
MLCAPGPVFGGTEGVMFRFQVLRTRTHYRLYRRRPVPFSCFALPDPFSAVPTTSGTFFMFCAPRLFFGGTDGVRSSFQVLRSRTHFRRYRGRRVPISLFALPHSFSAGPRASCAVFMFCALGLVFGVVSRFNVLRSKTHCLRYRRHCFPFSCCELIDSFLVV